MSLKEYGASYYLLCFVAFFSMFSVMITNPILSLFAKEIGASGVWIGYAVSGYWISRVVLEIPSGYISSRFGYFKPMAFGLLLTVFGNVLLVLVNNPIHLVLIRALKGFGAPFFFAISMTFIGSILMTSIMASYGIRYCFYLAALLMLITVPFVMLIQETGKIEGEVIFQ